MWATTLADVDIEGISPIVLHPRRLCCITENQQAVRLDRHPPNGLRDKELRCLYPPIYHMVLVLASHFEVSLSVTTPSWWYDAHQAAGCNTVLARRRTGRASFTVTTVSDAVGLSIGEAALRNRPPSWMDCDGDCAGRRYLPRVTLVVNQ